MLNMQHKSIILCLKKQNGDEHQPKLQNVHFQGTGLETERKTIYTFVFIYTNRKDFRKKRRAKSLESLFIL